MSKTLIIFLVLIPFVCRAQEYYVLQVKGHVKISKSDKELKTNDIVKANDKLIFSTDKDAVAVVSSKSGRLILKPTPTQGSSELAAIVKNILVPANNRLSTRNGSFNTPLDFQIYFADTVLLLSEMKHRVNPEPFPLSDTSFFFIRYTFQGQEINKKLFSQADSLIIKRNTLFSVDGKPIKVTDVSDFKLFHLNGSNSAFICALNMNIPDLNILRSETDVLKKVLSVNHSEEALMGEILTYLQFQYGKTDLSNLQAWYKK